MVVATGCPPTAAPDGPVLKYPGAKWLLADWIIGQMPVHRNYLEPFFGSGAVLLNKPRSGMETVNDLDHRVVNLFRVLREQPDELARVIALTPWAAEEHRIADAAQNEPTGDPVEDARRFLVVAWQSHGADCKWRNGWKRASANGRVQPANTWARLPERMAVAADRLRGVHVECRPAIDVILRNAHTDCLIYADPPYPRSTRYRAYYRHEMTDDDHRLLLAALMAHPGPVLLSGYRCALYDDLLVHWRRVDRAANAERGRARIESLWLNDAASRDARQMPMGVAL